MKAKVLFVDDDVRVLNALQRRLMSSGVSWQLLFESDPHQALKTAESVTPDVIVCDMRMPGLDGVSLLSGLRQRGSDALTIMLTGSDDLAVATAAINDAGVFKFFTKPCPTDTLIEGITAALDSRAARSTTRRPGQDHGMFDLLSGGVFVLDRDAHIVHANAAAQEMLETDPQIQRTPDGRLRVLESARPLGLDALVGEALDGRKTIQSGLERDDGTRPFSLTLRPLAERDLVALVVADPERVCLPSPDVIADVLRLSRSEAALVHVMALGASVTEAAQECNLSVQSARTYLKRIFQKTQTSRQSDLMRLVYSVFPNYLSLGAGERVT